ncbi:zinc knuckle CX2CX4HX4C containing protein [Tanacetum coccineum]
MENLADLNKREVFKDGDKLLHSIATRMNKMTGKGVNPNTSSDLSSLNEAQPKMEVRGSDLQVSSWMINNTNVETLFGVKFTSLSDIEDFSMSIKEGKYADILSTVSSADIYATVNLINDIEAGKHEELLSGMTNHDRMETLDALGSICNLIQANCNNLPSKASPSDPIVQSVDINTKSTLYAGAAGASTMAQPQVNSNFRPLVVDPVFNGVNISIPRKVVEKVGARLEHTLYGYFIGKRLAFPVFGLEVVLESGPWMIRNTPIILKKWSMSTSLLKEELTRIPIWVKLHDVPLQVFEEDGISLIATFIGKPIMLDSYTSSMCKDSWGRSSFARCLIEVNSEADLVDSVTISIPSLTGDDFTKETIHMVNPPIVTTSNVVAPTVEKSNDGFQTVGKKKKRKGKSKSTNGGQFTGPSVKQTVRYEPKATTIAPKKGATNVSNPSKSSSMLKTADTSPKNDNFTTSNSFSALNDEEVENVYDESAGLVPNINIARSSSFKAAAG